MSDPSSCPNRQTVRSAQPGGSDGADRCQVVAPWDWVGVIGTGQSLAVGTLPITSVTQPYGNLKLSLGDAAVPGACENPWDPNLSGLAVVPLVEPVHALQVDYPSPYPLNPFGERPHSAMANELTRLVKALSPGSDYVTVHSLVGESGQGIVELKKRSGSTTGITGRAYAASLFETAAIARLAREAGKTFGVGLILMTHGETDFDNPAYMDELVQLLADYNADLSAITGQSRKIPMYLSQQHALPNGPDSVGKGSLATQVQWRIGIEQAGAFVCTGPKYQYPANEMGDGIHLSATGYQMIGEKAAQIYCERAVLGRDWQPLQPVAVHRSGREVTVRLHVPVPPLRWDGSFGRPATAVWAQGRGFELRTPVARLGIESAVIDGDAVRITASCDLPARGLVVGYAMANQGAQLSNHAMAVRWGQLCDSDPFVGSTSKQANPNYCVSFEVPVP